MLAVLLPGTAGCGGDNEIAVKTTRIKSANTQAPMTSHLATSTPALSAPPQTTSTTAIEIVDSEPTEEVAPTEDLDPDGSTTLESAIRNSGNYTEDQILSMTMYMAFACGTKDSPQLAGMWTPTNIATDITDNYGFTITPTTARMLVGGCDLS